MTNTPQSQDLVTPDPPKMEDPPSRQRQEPTDAAPMWLQRLSIVILVVFCFYVGLLLFVLPWTRYWQENHFLATSATWGPILNSGAARGVISGLGLLDIWIGISEILHYRERRR